MLRNGPRFCDCVSRCHQGLAFQAGLSKGSSLGPEVATLFPAPGEGHPSAVKSFHFIA